MSDRGQDEFELNLVNELESAPAGTLLTPDQLVAAEGAKRLLSDPIFTGCMDEIVQTATQKAIVMDDAAEREANRQLVLAVGRIRGSLEAAIDYVESHKSEAQKARAFE